MSTRDDVIAAEQRYAQMPSGKSDRQAAADGDIVQPAISPAGHAAIQADTHRQRAARRSH